MILAPSNPVAARQHGELAVVFAKDGQPAVAAYHARRAVSFLQGTADAPRVRRVSLLTAAAAKVAR